MAESVMKRRHAFGAVGLLCLCVTMPAAYAQLRDPTRPPEQLGQSGETGAASGPVLQSVLLSPQRRIAVISGQTVKLGEKFGDATVVRISESEVVLRSSGSGEGGEFQTLRLFPSIGKQLTSDRKDRHPDNRK